MCVWVHQVRQVLQGQGIEGFLSEKKDISNAWCDQESMEIYEGGGDVFPELGAC